MSEQGIFWAEQAITDLCFAERSLRRLAWPQIGPKRDGGTEGGPFQLRWMRHKHHGSHASEAHMPPPRPWKARWRRPLLSPLPPPTGKAPPLPWLSLLRSQPAGCPRSQFSAAKGKIGRAHV